MDENVEKGRNTKGRASGEETEDHVFQLLMKRLVSGLLGKRNSEGGISKSE